MSELSRREIRTINSRLAEADSLMNGEGLEGYDARRWNERDPEIKWRERQEISADQPRVVIELEGRGFRVEEDSGQYAIYSRGQICAYFSLPEGRPPMLQSMGNELPDGVMRAFIKFYKSGFDIYGGELK